MECLVVETDRKKRAEDLRKAKPVSLETIDGVDSSEVHTLGDRHDVPAEICSAAILHKDVHVMVREAVDTPGPVILEAATEQADTIRPQRTRENVTCVSLKPAPLEPERDGPCAVDTLSVVGG